MVKLQFKSNFQNPRIAYLRNTKRKITKLFTGLERRLRGGQLHGAGSSNARASFFTSLASAVTSLSAVDVLPAAEAAAQVARRYYSARQAAATRAPPSAPPWRACANPGGDCRRSPAGVSASRTATNKQRVGYLR